MHAALVRLTVDPEQASAAAEALTTDGGEMSDEEVEEVTKLYTDIGHILLRFEDLVDELLEDHTPRPVILAMARELGTLLGAESLTTADFESVIHLIRRMEWRTRLTSSLLAPSGGVRTRLRSCHMLPNDGEGKADMGASDPTNEA